MTPSSSRGGVLGSHTLKVTTAVVIPVAIAVFVLCLEYRTPWFANSRPTPPSEGKTPEPLPPNKSNSGHTELPAKSTKKGLAPVRGVRNPSIKAVLELAQEANQRLAWPRFAVKVEPPCSICIRKDDLSERPEHKDVWIDLAQKEINRGTDKEKVKDLLWLTFECDTAGARFQRVYIGVAVTRYDVLIDGISERVGAVSLELSEDVDPNTGLCWDESNSSDVADELVKHIRTVIAPAVTARPQARRLVDPRPSVAPAAPVLKQGKSANK